MAIELGKVKGQVHILKNLPPLTYKGSDNATFKKDNRKGVACDTDDLIPPIAVQRIRGGKKDVTCPKCLGLV
ncbi:MAG: hypothetical protein UV36_C0003G0005 [Parcubacteria group bacterium GW2011_GWC2_42_6]|nr:MAG: hypothetical protein UU87_C0003G0063 [Parcubacteria group bacterium GW2011_GWA2_42_11]KKS68034.1 MAG: hypothetical protein UV36_C0003G0005 [Parcubacteria group bacterium GW2011_GWC2_42_6]